MIATLLRWMVCVGVFAPLAARAWVESWPSPAGADSGESSLHASADGTLWLTWCAPGPKEGERALWLASRPPGGPAWTTPRVVVSTPLLMENWADFPTLVRGTDGALTAQWFQRPEGDGKRGYEGWYSRSEDGGATWRAPAPLGHEFVALAPLSGGRTLAVWLESVRVPKDRRKPGDPSMRLQARMVGPDGATLKEWVVDPDTCTCCQNTVTVLPGDRVFVAYRGHRADEVRDNRYALFDGAEWAAPKTLHPDGWMIPACPVNGPAVDSVGESLAVVWYTAANGLARVQAKQSRDGGRTFGPAIPVDLGKPMGRVDLVMMPDGSSIVLWMEASTVDTVAGIYARRLFSDGRLSAPRLVAESSQARASGFPRAARIGADTVAISFTDTSGGGSRVRLCTVDAGALTAVAQVVGRRAPMVTRFWRERPRPFEGMEVCEAPAHALR